MFFNWGWEDIDVKKRLHLNRIDNYDFSINSNAFFNKDSIGGI